MRLLSSTDQHRRCFFDLLEHANAFPCLKDSKWKGHAAMGRPRSRCGMTRGRKAIENGRECISSTEQLERRIEVQKIAFVTGRRADAFSSRDKRSTAEQCIVVWARSRLATTQVRLEALTAGLHLETRVRLINGCLGLPHVQR